MSIIDELTADATPENFDETTMGVLATAVNLLIAKQQDIASAEEALKILKAEERVINQGEIPQLMANLGMEKLTLLDGRTLTVKEAVQVSIPAPMKIGAFAWMDENGHGDLIKIALTAKFARGESDKAQHALELINAYSGNASLTESVHTGTLKAWARVELEQGHSLPVQYFKVHVVKMTTVK